eukprot:scaffold58451_cov70-Phaeocystis_antarctica.AAC.7
MLGAKHHPPGAQPMVLRNGTYSLCTCPTPGSAGCPAWCTRRVFWSCVPWSACEGWCRALCTPLLRERRVVSRPRRAASASRRRRPRIWSQHARDAAAPRAAAACDV